MHPDDPICPRCQRVIERMEEHTYIREETRILICPRCRYEQELEEPANGQPRWTRDRKPPRWTCEQKQSQRK